MIQIAGYVAALVALVGVAAIVARLAFPLPAPERGGLSHAIPASTDTPMGRIAAAYDGQTGVHTLFGGEEAFAARILLARQAERSIDAQYYIWHGDLTGLLLLEALRDAADRGVRVRLLLDDNGIGGLDPQLAGLMAHNNVEVRLFNPFVLRRPKFANYLFDVVRLNRRMHNKSFTVDGAVSIVGGRNVGDEYFGAGTTGDYFDLDVMAVGGVVPEVARQFDRYWASEPVHAATTIIGTGEPGNLDRSIEAAKRDPRAGDYAKAVRDTKIVAAVLGRSLDLEAANVALVADDPAKGARPIKGDGLLMKQLEAQLGQVERRLDLVSAYFVPGEKGTEMLAGLARRGVRVQMLTNALEATDVLPVHAGYAKYRKALLRAGVHLFELKRGRADNEADDLGITGSSAASLHAKTFGVDSARVFVGSFNFDPRSLLLNTEMGLLIDSVAQATELERRFEQNVPTGAYAVEMAEGGDLAWVETAPGGKTTRRTSEPGSSWAKRLAVTVIGWLPVEWLL